MSDAPDPYRYVMEQPFATAPGERWTYSGGSTALLSAELKQAPRPAARRAGAGDAVRASWASPMSNGCATRMATWSPPPACGCGCATSPSSGQLVLEYGGPAGEQIVSAGWIEQSTAAQIAVEDQVAYGFQWWLGRSLIDGREVRWSRRHRLGRPAAVPGAGPGPAGDGHRRALRPTRPAGPARSDRAGPRYVLPAVAQP